MAMSYGNPTAPHVLGDYTVLTKLASGGMATVYVGRKRGAAGFERLVAIKCCHPHLRNNEEFSSMFLDEARLAASIRHSNVVGTLDVHDGELLYLVMEYIEGFSLANLMRHAAESETPVPPGIAVRVMIDALTGLHAAHELRDANGRFLNLVHRDVSPQNVLVGVDGVSRITDFGIAFASARATVTQAGRIKGKFAYIAPEQVKSQHATRRMDIFSAGAVLWEALTGRSLFRRQDDIATVDAVLNGPIPRPSRFAPDLPSEVDAVLLKALQRNPDDRYATAADFAEALDGLRLEHATMRAVAAHVETNFAEKLAERRKLIREAPDDEPAPASLDGEAVRSHVRSTLPPSTRGHPDAERAAGSTSSSAPHHLLVDGSGESYLPVLTAEEIEHRRLRGILAAVMLLLVGSAVGLLLARQSSAVTPAPAAPSVSPVDTAARPIDPIRNP
jgi:eukaryotic-like serine/threonine-protein kinase